MRARTPVPPAAAALLRAQSGVLSRGQLLELGVSRRALSRMLRDGILGRVTPGIYNAGGESGWLGKAWAGVLIGGGQAVLGLQAAAYLHGLTAMPPEEITIFTPRDLSDRPGWRFVEARRSGRGEPPRTTVEATVVDLCAQADPDAIAATIADAVSSRRTTAKRLLAEAEARSTIRHRATIREIVGGVRAGSHSSLEWRYQRDVERVHGLPEATRQGRIVAAHRGDAWYADHGVLVELDSKLHHSGGAAFRDMMRDNEHAIAGVLTLRFGWAHVVGVAACETAALVARVLMARGWEGPQLTCRRCARRHAI